MKIKITPYSQKRMGQRGITPAMLSKVIQHGKKLHRTGIIFYIMRNKDIPDNTEHRKEYEKLVGTTLLVKPIARILITAYKNGDSYRKNKKKGKQKIHILKQN